MPLPQRRPEGRISAADGSPMTVLLEAKALTKSYEPVMALDSVDFQMSDGMTGLLGLNRAELSTAIKLSLSLIRPSAGSVAGMGRRPYVSPEARERLGYFPKHDCLPPVASAAEFLSHIARDYRLEPIAAG